MKPTMLVKALTIADAWENALMELYVDGKDYPGRYWRSGLPVGKQANMIMRVESFTGEPRVHRGFTCTPEDLWDYRREILEGSDRYWEYTYHDRAFQWGAGVDPYQVGSVVNQYQYALDCLVRKPDTHKAVISFADPTADCQNAGGGTHIPCLRNLSFEIETTNGGLLVLNTYTHWRARNAVHASFNNMFGLSFLAEKAANDLSEMLSKKVVVGGYVDQSDDFHYNGKDAQFVQSFIALMKRSKKDRRWTTGELLELIGDAQ